MEAKLYYGQKDKPYSSAGIIFPNEVYLPTYDENNRLISLSKMKNEYLRQIFSERDKNV
jgi:hypothetical protein